MPSTSGFAISSYKKASALPSMVLDALEKNHIDANVVLPLLKKLCAVESASEQLWLCCISNADTVDFVLSCTGSDMINYPVFIVPTQPLSRWSLDALRARLRCLANELHEILPHSRVYSVFAPNDVVKVFAQQWTELTGIQTGDIYYSARLLSCNVNTLNSFSPASLTGTARLATVADTEDVARLCLGFSQENPPFVLDWDGALREARLLISKQQVWLHSLSREVTCIAAFTRNTEDMATITKVYTPPRWRRKGCAKNLVYQLCSSLLANGRRKIVLYVAHGNVSAARVYESVGFEGPGDSVDSGHSLNWEEWGFDQEKVELGHW